MAAEGDPASVIAPFVRRRLADAAALLGRTPGLTAAERRAVLATQWLAALADARGTAEGLRRIARANDLLAQVDGLSDQPQRALPLAREAWAEDHEDPAKACRVGALCRAIGDVDGAKAAFAAALGLAPSHAAAALALTALVAKQDGPPAALVLAEAQALAAPADRRLWENAAAMALAAGQGDRAMMLGQIALGCAPGSAGAHAHLARLHAATGDPLGQAFRTHTAARLKTAAAQGKD
jgi:tetratricopeptide (TPR) repeat protein